MKWLSKLLKKFDIFGQPVSIGFKGRSTHKTKLGGLVSVILTVVVLVYVSWRLTLYQSREREEFYTASIYQEFEEIGAVFLNDNKRAFQFEIYVENPEFDNDDNPYIKIKLHKYTNMDNSTDYYPDNPKTERDQVRDEIVPMVKCPDQEKHKNIWGLATRYCPGYTDADFIYGDYTSDKFAWYRVAVQFCDPEKRAL